MFPFLLTALRRVLPMRRDTVSAFFTQSIQRIIKQRDDLPPEQVSPARSTQAPPPILSLFSSSIGIWRLLETMLYMCILFVSSAVLGIL